MTNIVPFDQLSLDQREQAVLVLKEALTPISLAYRDLEAAKSETETFFGDPERFAVAAVEDGRVIGWIGWIRTNEYGWELHPLCVHPDHQRRGLGTLLVRTLEETARAGGIRTLYVGADDEFGATTVSGVDLFPDPASHIPDISATNAAHPLGFYRRMGFEVVGLLPDVNGPGKPDILLAKRI